MKTPFFLAASLVTILSYGQNTTVPSSTGGNGTDNVHVGHQVGDNTTIGKRNVFVGYQAGILNQIGYENVFLGANAGQNNIGNNNIFTGYLAGRDSKGNQNSYYGYGAGQYAEGTSNVFIGTSAGMEAVEENGIYIGLSAGRLSKGVENVFIGRSAGGSTEGENNVLIGTHAGSSAKGNKNVFIGYHAGLRVQGNNKLYIAHSDTANPLIYGDFEDKELKFNAGKVGIGVDFGNFPAMTTIPNFGLYKLFVRGGILAEEVRIRVQADWADYVFADDYQLLSLKETESYINKNGHLPNMPSAAQVKEEGIEMGNIIKLQQEKIEELTLHLIEQDKKMEELKAQVQLLLNK